MTGADGVADHGADTSAASDALSQARPRIRQGVVLGPPVRKGPVLVHLVKEPDSGRYSQLGVREYFLLSRLDGRATLEEIGADYAGRFGRRLDDRHWQQFLGMVGRRRLLEGAPPQGPLPEAVRGRQPSLGYRVWPLVAPEQWFQRQLPRLGFLFSPWTVLPALLGILAVLGYVASQAGTLYRDMLHLWQNPLVGVIVIAVVWLGHAVHESAHGLTATRYGGRSTEIGIMWRFPMLVPYCKVEDLLLLPHRRHRVYTAFAGMYATLLMQLPVLPIHLLSEPGTAAHRASSALLVIAAMTGAANLVPFLHLDGYAMLKHALGMDELQSESYRYLGLRLAHGRKRGERGKAEAYSPRLRAVYTAYSVASVLFGVGLAAGASIWWYIMLASWLGSAGATAVLTASALAVGALLLLRRKNRAERAAAGPPAGRG